MRFCFARDDGLCFLCLLLHGLRQPASAETIGPDLGLQLCRPGVGSPRQIFFTRTIDLSLVCSTPPTNGPGYEYLDLQNRGTTARSMTIGNAASSDGNLPTFLLCRDVWSRSATGLQFQIVLSARDHLWLWIMTCGWLALHGPCDSTRASNSFAGCLG